VAYLFKARTVKPAKPRCCTTTGKYVKQGAVAAHQPVTSGHFWHSPISGNRRKVLSVSPSDGLGVFCAFRATTGDTTMKCSFCAVSGWDVISRKIYWTPIPEDTFFLGIVHINKSCNC
jgi:hypothetical protein